MSVSRTWAGALLAIAAGLGLTGNAVAASKADEAAFVAQVKQIVAKKDVAAMLKLVAWEGGDERARGMVEGKVKEVVDRAPKDVTVSEWTDYPFKATLPVTRRLRFTFDKGEVGSMPLGEKNGKLMIAAPAAPAPAAPAPAPAPAKK